MNLALAVCFAVAGVIVVALPFFFGPGGLLQAAAADNNVDRLVAAQGKIIERYLQDERAASTGEISKASWQQRRAFLTARYVDVTRRIDFLNTIGSSR